MKKLLFLLLLIASLNGFAQLATIEPTPTIATEKITIYVDLSKLDLTLDHNKLLSENAGPFYIWTWKPAELPVGHPNVNGTGEKAWQNSNDALLMSPAPEKGPKVWKYEMIPTAFYGVTASQVYASGIYLLVKPKNGGGYGDPDIKSNDIVLPVEPPKTDKGALYVFPTVLLEKEITTIVYDNEAEKKPTMQNLDPGTTMYAYMKATAKDTATNVVTTYEPYRLLQVQNNPALKMTNNGKKWSLGLIVQDYFNFPSTSVPVELEIRAIKQNWTSDDDTGGNFDKVPKVPFGCK